MTETTTVRITASVFWDIVGRDMDEHYGIAHLVDVKLPANVEMPTALAVELADDARYQSDVADAGYSQPFGLRMAYATLAKRIEKASR